MSSVPPLADPPKVFGIGLSRTGTKSLTAALRLLGYRAAHYPLDAVGVDGDRLRLRPQRLRRWQAATDTPIAHFFRELDAAFPGSRYVLTVRDRESWLHSIERHLEVRRWFSWTDRRIVRLDRELYGARHFERRRFGEAWERHVTSVREWFRDRSDLLVLDVAGGDGWEPLCAFLGHSIPDREFPHRNPGYHRILERLPGVVKSLGSS